MTSPDSSPPSNKYVIDSELPTETARLIEQDKLLTQAMGGLLPEEPDLSSAEQIIDLACGPGKWAIDLAFAYPDIEIIGVDLNTTIINYADALARSRGLANVTFEVMDIKKTLEFEDNTFDLVNARSIVGLMDKGSWSPLLAECKRILKPGGLIRLTEGEAVVTNSAALQRLNNCLTQTMYKQGRTYSADGNSFGIAYILGTMLRNAGFEKIGKRPFILDASYGTEQHYSSCKDAETFFPLIKPFFLKSGLITEEEFDQLYQTMLIDTLGDDFTCITFELTTWGSKEQE
jgi:ubiquinone/menaquinone biosynthesis C-methylase UbiE